MATDPTLDGTACESCGCTEDDVVCTCRVCGDGTEDIPANPNAPYYQKEPKNA